MVASLDEALCELNWSAEIILVDDASTDETFDIITRLFDQYTSITHAIQLMRNSGQTFAMTPGIVAASGEYIGIIDSDLQYDPRDLCRLAEEAERGFDVVSGYRVRRQDALYRRLVSTITSALVRLISGLPLRDYGCSLKILDGNLLRTFDYSPLRPFHPLSAILAAGKLSNVAITHRSRKYGRSGWKLIYLWYYFVDMLIVLFQRPTHLAGMLCFAFSAFTLTVGGLSLAVLNPHPPVTSYTLLILLIFVFFTLAGTGMATLSLLLRTFLLTMRQPAYVIRTHLSRGGDELDE